MAARSWKGWTRYTVLLFDREPSPTQMLSELWYWGSFDPKPRLDKGRGSEPMKFQ